MLDIESVLHTIGLIGPEFDEVPEAKLRAFVDLASSGVSEKMFGKDYSYAVALLTCHKLKMAGHGSSSLAGSITDTARLTSISEGDVSLSFAANTGTGSADAEYRLTSYGLQYLTLRSQYRVSILINHP